MAEICMINYGRELTWTIGKTALSRQNEILALERVLSLRREGADYREICKHYLPLVIGIAHDWGLPLSTRGYANVSSVV